MPWSPWLEFSAQILAEAPDLDGVYAFRQKGIVIYYGIARGGGGLRAKLDAHWHKEGNPCLLLARERDVQVNWYPTPDPESMVEGLLQRFVQQRARLPRCNQAEQAGQKRLAPQPSGQS